MLCYVISVLSRRRGGCRNDKSQVTLSDACGSFISKDRNVPVSSSALHQTIAEMKLSCCRGTARRCMTVDVLSAATMQYENIAFEDARSR